MIKWREELYIHSDIEDSAMDIMNDLLKKSNYNIYCIIKALDKRNLYEILSVMELSNGMYDNKQIEIIGIAKGKKNIKEVLIDVVEAEFCKI